LDAPYIHLRTQSPTTIQLSSQSIDDADNDTSHQLALATRIHEEAESNSSDGEYDSTDIGPLALLGLSFRTKTKKGIERTYTVINIKCDQFQAAMYEVQFDDDDDDFTVWLDEQRFDAMHHKSVSVLSTA
jgi:hypothetical protein